MPAPTHKKPKDWTPPDIPYISVVHSSVDTTGRALIYKLDAATGESVAATRQPRTATRKPGAKKNQKYQEWRRYKRVPMEFRDLVMNMYSPVPLTLLCKTFVIMWQFDKQPAYIEAIYERAVIDIIAGKLKSTGGRDYDLTPCDFYHWFTRSNHFRFRKEPWMATLAMAFAYDSAGGRTAIEFEAQQQASAAKSKSQQQKSTTETERISTIEIKRLQCRGCGAVGKLRVQTKTRAGTRYLKCKTCKKHQKLVVIPSS